MSADTLRRFYAAFAALDGAAMQACYAERAHFDDPAFTLDGRERIGAMWRMLCDGARARGPGHWRLEARVIDDTHAHWEAWYRFGPPGRTGRAVHNRIDARFAFDADGLILRHEDRFDFAAWARQALGWPGRLLGGTPWLRQRVRAQAARQLERFIARDGRGSGGP